MNRRWSYVSILFTLLAVSLVSATGALSVAAQSAPAEAVEWEGMEVQNEDYDWLRPPDSALQDAIALAAEGELASVPLYTFQCGEPLGCQKRFQFKKKRTVARITFASPIRLAAEEVASRYGRQGAPPNPEEMRTYHGTFAVSLLLQAKKRGDKPSIRVQVGGQELHPTATSVSGRRIERCWVKRDDKCWRTRHTATFRVAEGVALTGAGEITVRWHEDEFSLTINFDYLR